MEETPRETLPSAILFVCTLNTVRSPMAAAIMRHLYGEFVTVESAGVRTGERDPFAHEVMEEIGIALGAHKPRRFEDLVDGAFDLVITLSPEAQYEAMALARGGATRIEYWPTFDPSSVEGTREQRMDAYRGVRDELMRRLAWRFARRAAADT